MTGKRYLVLENGKIFEGEPLGAPGEEISEIVYKHAFKEVPEYGGRDSK